MSPALAELPQTTEGHVTSEKVTSEKKGDKCSFTAPERDEFRAEDVTAATHIAMILFSILGVALIAYVGIWWWVAAMPNY